jgi:putative endonuclease
MKWSVYILKCKDKTLYTGITTDLERRFKEHQSGAGANYTRAHKPLKIVHFEKLKSRSSALKREARIKRMTRAEKLALIKSGRETKNR